MEDRKRDWRIMVQGSTVIGGEYLSAKSPIFAYVTTIVALSFTSQAKPEKVLFFGLGIGSVLKMMYLSRTTSIDIVEISKAVVEVANRDFELKAATNNRTRIFVQDLRSFVDQFPSKEPDTKYGWIVHDVFSLSHVASDTITIEIIRKIKALLTHEGILVLNIVGTTQGKFSRPFELVYNTLSSVFSHVRCFPETDLPQEDVLRNIVCFSSDEPIKFTLPETLLARILTGDAHKKKGDMYSAEYVWANLNQFERKPRVAQSVQVISESNHTVLQKYQTSYEGKLKAHAKSILPPEVYSKYIE